ncbi:MAG: Gfo/Idh/MocA family oxidoreductase [Planctomycetes bacterium]|nr:Gfo/Idh/MocA family oxidoreductase [Planctomycetota bacterium]MCH8967540.1 Gfo/Idh/MocA family oxidoreductase [Planctomycetota bacterium]
MSKPFQTVVVGVGHMGAHHARVYSELPESKLVAIVDVNLKRAQEIAHKYGCAAYARVDEVKDHIDAASVAVPTVLHREVAEPLLARGIAVLVEKPIAPDVPEATALLECAEKYNALLQIGHSERFNPVVMALKRMEIVPKFIETHRISPFTFRSADIGVVFDMMIHDIDIVLNLVKQADYTVQAVGMPVLVRKNEDIANARIQFSDGCVANMTASRLALKSERIIRVFSQSAYLSMDFARKTGIAITIDGNLDILQMAREGKFEDISQMKHADFGSLVTVEPLDVDDIEPLRAELSSFLNALRTGTKPEVSGEEGVAAVKMATEIVNSLRSHDFKIKL